jgi:O-antigen/teichoic acid export membrane protein
MQEQEIQNLSQENVTGKETSGITRLFRHSAVYTLSTSVQRLQGLILTPIYTNLLYLPEMSQYSNYGLVYTFIAFMNFVYMYGMDSAFLRYYFLGKTDRKTVFSTTFFILLLSGIISSLLVIIFSRSIASSILFNKELYRLIQLAAVILFLDSLGNLPFLLLRSEERPVAFTVFRMVRFFLEIILNFLFVVKMKLGVPGILYANIIAAIINLVIMFPFTWKSLAFTFNRGLLAEMFRFGLPFLPNGIAYMTIEMIDRFLVTKYLGKDVLAFYHANYKFASVLLLIIVGFRNAWQPFFLKVSKQLEAPAIYSRVLRYYLLTAGIIIIFVTLFINDLLTYRYFNSFYLLGTEYWQGISFIPWIILSYFFFGIYTIFTPAFYIHKKSQYMMLFTGAGAVFNIFANIWLLPEIGIWGAVIATVFAYLIMAVSIVVVSQKIYPVPIDLGKTAVLFLLISLIYILYFTVDLSFILRLLVFVAYVLISWMVIFPASEKSLIYKKIFKFHKVTH